MAYTFYHMPTPVWRAIVVEFLNYAGWGIFYIYA
jgi:hypothetical protein